MTLQIDPDELAKTMLDNHGIDLNEHPELQVQVNNLNEKLAALPNLTLDDFHTLLDVLMSQR